jgi:hypothetical protein
MGECSKEIGHESLDCIHLAEVMPLLNFSALMNTIKNHSIVSFKAIISGSI